MPTRRSDMDDRALRDKVVLAMLPDVPFEGWSRRALRHAAKRVDLTEAELSSLFPRGVRDVVAAFSDWADRATEATLAKQHPARLKLRERIALGVRTRLAVLEPHREAVRRMLAYLTLPANLPLGPRLLYRTVDMLWHAAGDRATDFSFYTKRGLLAGIYATTTLYWLDDKSPNHHATAEFLDRRIAEVMQIPKLRGRATAALSRLPNPLRAFGILARLRRA
ncbi:MAG: COQ9 family protein [Alphaproteobacteria bacterium]|nr:COQ9 family protein [Alphaproteobacteria bacterium]